MILLAKIVVALIALLHLWIMVVEMALWDKPIGLKMFKNSPEKAQATKIMAQNQGIYNGFLSAGLFWSLIYTAQFQPLAVFFLSCVAVAGIVGGLTASRKIIMVQTVPAVVGILLVLLSGA